MATKDYHSFFIGAVNRIYRIDLKSFPPSSEPETILSLNGSKSLRFEAFKKILTDIGPYHRNEQCQMNNDLEECLDNEIRHMFFYGNTLFACGTGRCGLCDVIIQDFSHKRIFGLQIISQNQSLAYRKSCSKNDNYDQYLVKNNFITSSFSSLIFFGNHFNKDNEIPVFYTAFSNDDRQLEFQVPFITSRVPVSYKINDKVNMGFKYVIDSNNQKSEINLIKNYHFKFKFITGFSYKRFAYFLFMEYGTNSPSGQLRLGRLCENDPKPLNSYMETILVCNEIGSSNIRTKATAAHLSITISGSQTDGFQTQTEQSEMLLVSFDGNDDDHSSAICSFNMDKLDKHFRDYFSSCITIGNNVSLLGKFNHNSGPCRSDNVKKDQQCPISERNRYIDIKKPFTGYVLAKFQNDSLTSLGSVRINNIQYEESLRQHMFAGTKSGRLYKFTMTSEHIKADYIINITEPLLTMQNLTFDVEKATFYLLTKKSLIRLPMTDCGVYNSCSSCFRSIRTRFINNACYWYEGHCHLRSQIQHLLTEDKIQFVFRSCPPIIHDYWPKRASTSGGTILTFYGENFGELNKNGSKLNSHLNISLETQYKNIPCHVIFRNDTLVKCQIEFHPFKMTSSSPITSIIHFDALDLQNISLRTFSIRGQVKLSDFRFMLPKIYAIHPPKGPFMKRTKILIIGENLHVGSNVTITIEDRFCKLLTRNVNYIICLTPKLNMSDIITPRSKFVIVNIDSSKMELNSNQPVEIKPDLASLIFENNANYENKLNEMLSRQFPDPNVHSRHKRKLMKRSSRRRRKEFHNVDDEDDDGNDMILNWTQINQKDDDKYLPKLFLFRFNYMNQNNRTLIFNQHFTYYPSPNFILEDTFTGKTFKHTVFSGNYDLEFNGKYLNSIYYPELKLTCAEHLNLSWSTHFIIPCSTCENASSHECLACRMPSLKKLQAKINSPTSCNVFCYQWTIDDDNSESKECNHYIVYNPDPIFETFQDRSLKITNLTITMNGSYLNPYLSYRIMLNDKYRCETAPKSIYWLPDQVTKLSKFFSLLDQKATSLECKFNMSDEERNELIGTPMNLTAQISAGKQKILIAQVEMVSEKDHSHQTLFLLMVSISSIFIFSIFGLICLFIYVRRNLPKTYEQIDQREMATIVRNNFSNGIITHFSPISFTDRLKQIFREEDKESMYEELHARDMFITDPSRLEVLPENSGSGEFGVIYIGKLKDETPAKTVAVKVNKINSSNGFMLKEMKIMKDFNHRNVMSLLYATLVKHPHSEVFSLALVMPYMDHKDLHNYVLNPDNRPTISDIINYSKQIAEGMAYLSNKNFVHRDLAARNCLLDKNGTVKIGDFGLSRTFQNDKEYYKLISREQKLPIKWMALESLKTFHFTTKSDVWSYGVTIWELYTRGRIPYENIPSDRDRIIQYLDSGYRLDRPNYVPELLWIILMKCWLNEPDERPSFEDIVQELEDVVQLFIAKRAKPYLDKKMFKMQNSNGCNGTLSTLSTITADQEPVICRFNFTEQNIQNKLQNHYHLVKNQINQMSQLDERNLFCFNYDNANLIDDYGNVIANGVSMAGNRNNRTPVSLFGSHSVTDGRKYCDDDYAFNQNALVNPINEMQIQPSPNIDHYHQRDQSPPPYQEATQFPPIDYEQVDGDYEQFDLNFLEPTDETQQNDDRNQYRPTSETYLDKNHGPNEHGLP